MKVRINSDAIAAVIAAGARSEPKSAMKPLYIRRNTFDVDPDAPIYRTVPMEYVFDDIRNGHLTHTRISPRIWGDASENPLLNRTFPDAATGGTFTLNGVVENMFGSCWSLTPLVGNSYWATFSHGKPSVRLESTPSRLLSAVMNEGNPHYELQHAIGKVHYLTAQELESRFSDPDYEKYLDSLGHGIYLSMMRLGTDMQSENEVRLVCDFMHREPWVQRSVRRQGEFLEVPFDWTDSIRSVVVGPLVDAGGRQFAEQELRKLGITCQVTSSSARAHSD